MQGEHTHYEKYITRIVRVNTKSGIKEFIEFICEEDGLIFKRVKIKTIK